MCCQGFKLFSSASLVNLFANLAGCISIQVSILSTLLSSTLDSSVQVNSIALPWIEFNCIKVHEIALHCMVKHRVELQLQRIYQLE